MNTVSRRPAWPWAALLAALWLCAAPLAAREPAPVTVALPAEGTQAPAEAGPSAGVPVPTLTGPVVDLTGSLDAAAVAHLSERSLELQRRKGAQLMLLMLDSTGGEDIAAYAGRVFAQ